MDQLDMECTWSQPIHKGYIILSDLLMEGGILEGHTLKECSSDSDNINPAPNCYISWKERVCFCFKFLIVQLLKITEIYTERRQNS